MRIESCPEHVMGGWSSYSMGRRSQYIVSSMGGVDGAYFCDLQHKMTFKKMRSYNKKEDGAMRAG